MKPTFLTSRRSAFTQLLCYFSIIVFFSSCASYEKIAYFQDYSRSRVTVDDITNTWGLTIQPEDQLAINVGSVNPEAAAPFNNNVQNAGQAAQSPVYGYFVDKSGNINLPLLGVVKVAGLTTDELSTQLQRQLETFLGKPSVSVRIINFKVAVLGDVMRPNIYQSPSERLTITEALALAGDLNITALRDDILLVREVDGKRTVIPINLKKKEVFSSPYFYMKANDLLFVQAGKEKAAATDTGYRNASLVISALSLIAIAASMFVR